MGSMATKEAVQEWRSMILVMSTRFNRRHLCLNPSTEMEKRASASGKKIMGIPFGKINRHRAMRKDGHHAILYGPSDEGRRLVLPTICFIHRLDCRYSCLGPIALCASSCSLIGKGVGNDYIGFFYQSTYAFPQMPGPGDGGF